MTWALGLVLIAIGIGLRYPVREVLIALGMLLFVHDVLAHWRDVVGFLAVLLFSTDRS